MIALVRSNPVVPDPRVEKEVRSLVAHGFRVTILAWDREGAFNKVESAGNKIIYRFGLRTPYGNLSVVAYYPLFWLWVSLKLLRIRPMIVHACDVDSVFPGLFYRLLNRKAKVIFDLFDSYALLIRPRSRIVSNIVLFLERFAASMSDAFITVSSQQLALFDSAKPKIVEIVMNCPPLTLKLNSSQATKPEGFRVVYAGIISEDRGLLQLCKATKDIDDLKLIIAGRVVNKKVMDEVNKFSHARYIGQLNYEDALKLQATADIIPILYDPSESINRVAMPNKIFEAMMFGIPIITNLAHLVKETHCGIVVDYHDKETMKQAILRIKENPKIKLQLGENGRRAYEQKYNWPCMEKKLLELYDKFLSLTL